MTRDCLLSSVWRLATADRLSNPDAREGFLTWLRATAGAQAKAVFDASGATPETAFDGLPAPVLVLVMGRLGFDPGVESASLLQLGRAFQARDRGAADAVLSGLEDARDREANRLGWGWRLLRGAAALGLVGGVGYFGVKAARKRISG